MGRMAVWAVVTLALLLASCGGAEQGAKQGGKEGQGEAASPKTVNPSAQESRPDEPTTQGVVGNMPIAGIVGENVKTDSYGLRVLDYFVSDSYYYLSDPYLGEVQDFYSEAGKFVVVNYSVTNTSPQVIGPNLIAQLHVRTEDGVEVYEQDDEIAPPHRLAGLYLDDIPPRQMLVSQFIFDVPVDVEPELAAITEEPTMGNILDVGVVDLAREDPQGPRPEEILALQYEYGNMTAWEQAYELFAQESKDVISEQAYVSGQKQGGIVAFTEYSFPSVDIQGDRATIERVATYANEEEGGQDKATQEAILTGDGWRIVMRDEQIEIFSEG